MAARTLLLLYLLAFLAGCKKHVEIPGPEGSSSFLLQKANDEKRPAKERLDAAQMAYDAAVTQHNLRVQMSSMRAMGVAYVKMDSLSQAMLLFQRLATLAGRLGDKESEGVALHNTGLILSERSVYDSAVIYYEKAGRLLKAVNDSVRVIEGMINCGIAYKNMAMYQQAFRATSDALTAMSGLRMPNQKATALTAMANVMKELHRPSEALGYHRQAIAIRAGQGDSAGVAGSLNNMGNVYKSIGSYNNALVYYFQSIEIKRRLNLHRSAVTTLDNIAETYLGLKRYEEAERYELQVLAQRDSLTDKDGWMTSASRLASIYLARGRYKEAEAIAYVIAAMAGSHEYRKQQMENVLLLVSISEKTGNNKAAAAFSAKALVLKDSLFNETLSSDISQMNVLLETAAKEQKLALSEHRVSMQAQQVRLQRYFLLFLSGMVLLLAIIVYLLYVSNKQRKRSREHTEMLMSELNHRVTNNMQIISGILNLQTLTTDDEKEISLIRSGRNRVQAMAVVHRMLYQKEYTGAVDMHQFINKIITNLKQALWESNEVFLPALQVDTTTLKADQAIPLGLIINETLTNIFKYNQTKSIPLEVAIAFGLSGDRYYLQIADNGMAWDVEEARSRKKGLGLMLIDMLVRQLKGSLQYSRDAGKNVQNITFEKPSPRL